MSANLIGWNAALERRTLMESVETELARNEQWALYMQTETAAKLRDCATALTDAADRVFAGQSPGMRLHMVITELMDLHADILRRGVIARQAEVLGKLVVRFGGKDARSTSPRT